MQDNLYSLQIILNKNNVRDGNFGGHYINVINHYYDSCVNCLRIFVAEENKYIEIPLISIKEVQVEVEST